MTTYEVNFDGLVGPTHNYSGLSYGNLASQANIRNESNPQAAALQGLEKMHMLAQMGIKQAVLPPHERPYIPILRELGFSGTPEEIVQAAWKNSPETLLACGSAAAMWTANAATIAPSSDTTDHKLHITPANLLSKFHRALEGPMTTRILYKIFGDKNLFSVHAPLPPDPHLTDEGAANHTRFCQGHKNPGIHLFVFGKYAKKESIYEPRKFPARQTYEASEAVAKQNSLDLKRVIFAQQNPDAIDAGAFHNDVISVGNENVFLYHEKAFLNTTKTIEEIQKTFQKEMVLIEVKESDLAIIDAVNTYLFNSQIVTLPDGNMALIAPTECKEFSAIQDLIKTITKDPNNPIHKVEFFNLRQSMYNGGGPACLRLRIVMTEQEIAAAHQGMFLDDGLYVKLKSWIKKHYRDRFKPGDLADPKLLDESYTALDELTQILNIGTIYPFQTS